AGGVAVAQRADRVAAAAAKYGASRSAFLNAWAAELEQTALGLESFAAGPPPPVESARSLQNRMAAEIATVGRSIDVYAGDPDPGFQQVRQALEREKAALDALNSAMAEREKAAGAAQDTTGAAEKAGAKA